MWCAMKRSAASPSPRARRSISSSCSAAERRISALGCCSATTDRAGLATQFRHQLDEVLVAGEGEQCAVERRMCGEIRLAVCERRALGDAMRHLSIRFDGSSAEAFSDETHRGCLEPAAQLGNLAQVSGADLGHLEALVLHRLDKAPVHEVQHRLAHGGDRYLELGRQHRHRDHGARFELPRDDRRRERAFDTGAQARRRQSLSDCRVFGYVHHLTLPTTRLVRRRLRHRTPTTALEAVSRAARAPDRAPRSPPLDRRARTSDSA